MSFADKILDSFVKEGSKFRTFSIQLPDGKVIKPKKGKDVFKVIIKKREVFNQVALKGTMGVGEQYMLGNIEIEGNLSEALRTADDISFSQKHGKGNPVGALATNVMFKIFTNSRHKSLKNVQHHYDLGNDFYEEWLDKSLTYSCAYFKDNNDTLDKAQEQKLDHICKKLLLKKGETLLDIGCGWGSMLIYAAQKYGIKGYGVSLSKEQIEYAKQRAKKLHLDKLVTFELKDYRDVEGTFDKIVSIGMFEHVGYQNYSTFFKHCKKALKSNGLFLLHTIGVAKTNYDMVPHAWTLKYIFPGGYLPSPTQIMEASSNEDLVAIDLENLRPHYALTAGHWLKNYEKVFDKTAKERGIEFARMWKLYLAVTEIAFEYGSDQLYHVLFTNGNNNEVPLTRAHMYK